MEQSSPKYGISYKGGFFMLWAFMIVGMLLGYLIASPVWERLTGTDIGTLIRGPFLAKNVRAVQIVQVITMGFSFLLPPFIVWWLISRRPFENMNANKGVGVRDMAFVAAIAITMLLVSSALGSLSKLIPLTDYLQQVFEKMELDYNRQMKGVLKLDSIVDLSLALFVIGLVPAICEEFFFRGGAQNLLFRITRKPIFSIIVTAAIFSAMHFSFYGFIPRIFAGVVLGYVYYYTKNIWLNIWLHFLNNAIGVLMIYVGLKQGKSIEALLKDDSSGYWGLLALPVIVILFILWKILVPRPVESESESLIS